MKYHLFASMILRITSKTIYAIHLASKEERTNQPTKHRRTAPCDKWVQQRGAWNGEGGRKGALFGPVIALAAVAPATLAFTVSRPNFRGGRWKQLEESTSSSSSARMIRLTAPKIRLKCPHNFTMENQGLLICIRPQHFYQAINLCFAHSSAA